MAIDLTGGLDEAREFLIAQQPDDPEMRESVNAWVWDNTDDVGGTVGLPRIGIEAVADQWNTHDVQLNIAFADGRVLTYFEPGKVHDRLGPDGRPRVLGGGPLSFELIEPFGRWRMRFDGLAVDNRVEKQMAGGGRGGEPTVPVEFDLDLVSAAPPWENGELLPEAGRVLREQEEGALMGGPRYEQLARMTGSLRVADQRWQLRGGALRIRRQGVRRLARFWGHAWQSAVFPSGRAFGFLTYPAREDGRPTYNEAFLFDGDGALIPARVLEAPWLRRMQPRGQHFQVVLGTEDGRTETISGESLVSAFSVIPVTADMSFPVLQQAIVRYTWGDEAANGMMERSTLPENMDSD